MKRYFLITGLVGAGLLSGVGLAACGGDDSPETPIVVTDQTQQLDKEAFIAQADAICAEANTEIANIAAAGEGITRAADVADLRQGVLTDIRDLGTPIDTGSSSESSTDTSSADEFGDTSDTSTSSSEDTSTFPEDETGTGATATEAIGTDATDTSTAVAGDDLDVFLAALEQQVRAGEKIDLATQRGETTADAEAELQTAKDEAAEAATSYGFEECGTEGTASSDATDTSSSSGTSVAPSAPVTPAPSTGGGTGDTGGDTSGGGVSPGGGVAPSP